MTGKPKERAVTMDSWKELEVWQGAHALVLSIHELVATLPPSQRYRLGDQLCRSAASVPANIVEGQSRQTTKEYVHFLYNARGSLEETRYHLLLARDLGLVEQTVYTELEAGYRTVSKMLNGLIQSLRTREAQQ